MLVLRRRIGQVLHIGGVQVRVLNTTTRKVRLGVEAPPEVTVYREELLGSAARPAKKRGGGTLT